MEVCSNSPDFIDLIFVAQSAAKATFLAAAIRKCGGKEEKGKTLYNAYGSNGQVCIFFTYNLLNVDLWGRICICLIVDLLAQGTQFCESGYQINL